MANTRKLLSERDSGQTLQAAAVLEDDSLMVNGFLAGKVGRKITQTISTTLVTGDTATFEFSEDGISLYTYKIIYTDATQDTLISAERIA